MTVKRKTSKLVEERDWTVIKGDQVQFLKRPGNLLTVNWGGWSPNEKQAPPWGTKKKEGFAPGG